MLHLKNTNAYNRKKDETVLTGGRKHEGTSNRGDPMSAAPKQTTPATLVLVPQQEAPRELQFQTYTTPQDTFFPALYASLAFCAFMLIAFHVANHAVVSSIGF
jgi:hypothetical protein